MIGKARSPVITLTLLALIQVAEGFDIFLVGKVAPLIARSLGVATYSLKWAFVLHHAGLAAGAVLGGLLADRHGAVKVLATSLAGAGLVTLFVPWCSDLLTVTVARGMTGIFLGAAGAVVLASASLVGADKGQMGVAIMLAAYSIGSSLGSLYAFVLAEGQGWQMGFIIAALWLLGLAPAAALLVATWPVRTMRLDAPAPPSVDRGLPMICLAFALSMGLVSMLNAWTPTFFQELAGVPVSRFGLVGLLYAPAAVAGVLGTGWIIRWQPLGRIAFAILGGHAAALLALGALRFGSALFSLTYALSIFAQAAGQAVLNVLVARRSTAAQRGKIFGLAAAAGRMGGVVTPWIGAIALDARVPIQTIFALGALVPILVLICLQATLNLDRSSRL